MPAPPVKPYDIYIYAHIPIFPNAAKVIISDFIPANFQLTEMRPAIYL